MLSDTLKTLCALSGPSSYEDPVRDFLIERVKAVGAEYRVDPMGNLIVTKKGKISSAKHLMLSTHMDEVGLMVKRITDEGYLKFGTLGEIDRRVLIGKQVCVGKGRHPGVVGLKAIHLTSREERKHLPKLESMYIDIGAKDREEAEKLTHLGDFAVFCDNVGEFGQDLLKAKAIDARIGCAVMAELITQELPMDCTFAFTVQSEVGSRGAFGAAFSVKPDLALVLEGTAAGDLPDCPRPDCCLGLGPVLPYMDGVSVSDREMFELLRDLAKEHGIPWQTKSYLNGGTDGGAIQRSWSGVRTATLSLPVRYAHSPSCLASLQDCKFTLELAEHLIQAVADGRM